MTRVTEAKKQRAIAALVDLMQCDDFPDKGNGTCYARVPAAAVTLTDFLLARIAEDEAQAGWLALAGMPRQRIECEAKRRIVGRHSGTGDGSCLRCVCADTSHDSLNQPCATLRALALPYADHPDYREEWKP